MVAAFSAPARKTLAMCGNFADERARASRSAVPPSGFCDPTIRSHPQPTAHFYVSDHPQPLMQEAQIRVVAGDRENVLKALTAL